MDFVITVARLERVNSLIKFVFVFQVAECKGRIFYLTSKDLHPGTEFLTFYGEEYLEALNINITEYYDMP